jgi:GNAT superfamily N-acetyltransferase
MQVRSVTEADIPALARLRLALLEETGAALDAAARAELLHSNAAFFRENLASPLWQSWLADVDGEAVAIGTLTFFIRPPYPGNPEGIDAYLLNMYTLPSHRGQGAASAIVQAAKACARERGARKVILHATEAGRSRYTQAGFRASSAYMELSLEPRDA